MAPLSNGSVVHKPKKYPQVQAGSDSLSFGLWVSADTRKCRNHHRDSNGSNCYDHQNNQKYNTEVTQQGKTTQGLRGRRRKAACGQLDCNCLVGSRRAAASDILAATRILWEENGSARQKNASSVNKSAYLCRAASYFPERKNSTRGGTLQRHCKIAFM